MADVFVGVEEIVGYFDELEDPRSTINQKHPLSSVIVIAIMAVLSGSTGPTSIAKWAKLKKDFMVGVLDLPNGAPRSHDKKNDLGALHSVSVWASEYGLSLGQVACAEKSNEITAIPTLLKPVDVKGAIITIDAMGTQKAIASQIIAQKADYVLALKGNQERLHDEVVAYVDALSRIDFADIPVRRRRHTTTDHAHGREEIRNYFHMPLTDVALWKRVKSIGVVASACTRDGKETIETRCYISSLAVGVKQFAHAVRSHWGIENGCHCTLDVTFREYDSRIRDKHARENIAWLNRLALSLLKQHPEKNSVAMKRRSCAWSEAFPMGVLTGLQG